MVKSTEKPFEISGFVTCSSDHGGHEQKGKVGKGERSGQRRVGMQTTQRHSCIWFTSSPWCLILILSPDRIRQSSWYHRLSTSSWLTSHKNVTGCRSMVSTSSSSFKMWMSLADRKHPIYESHLTKMCWNQMNISPHFLKHFAFLQPIPWMFWFFFHSLDDKVFMHFLFSNFKLKTWFTVRNSRERP